MKPFRISMFIAVGYALSSALFAWQGSRGGLFNAWVSVSPSLLALGFATLLFRLLTFTVALPLFFYRAARLALNEHVNVADRRNPH
jgi:hypothetical protein